MDYNLKKILKQYSKLIKRKDPNFSIFFNSKDNNSVLFHVKVDQINKDLIKNGLINNDWINLLELYKENGCPICGGIEKIKLENTPYRHYYLENVNSLILFY